MTSFLVKGATIVTVNPRFDVIRDGAVFVEDGTIKDVGRTNEVLRKYPSAEFVVDGTGKLVMPGLVNMHTHMFQTLMRGLGDDMALIAWIRDMLYKYSANLDVEAVQAGAELSCLEMIRSGVTSVVDNHHMCTGEDAVGRVASTILGSGLRGFVARGMKVLNKRTGTLKSAEKVYEFDEDEEVKITEKCVKYWLTKGEGRVRVCPGPVSILTTTRRLLEEAGRISVEHDLPLHIHIAEVPEEVDSTVEDYGCREVEYLHRLGILTMKTHVVHGVWIDDSEIGLMAREGANLVHCPVSNMYLSSGVAPIKKLLASEVNVGLGTDGPASNNSHDMFEVMKLAALLTKVSTLQPESITAKQVVYMATMGGARALGLDGEVGSLERGKKGDLVVVNLHAPNSTPVHNPVSSAVYTCRSSNVEAVLADGAPLMIGGRLTHIDEERVLANAEDAASKLVSA